MRTDKVCLVSLIILGLLCLPLSAVAQRYAVVELNGFSAPFYPSSLSPSGAITGTVTNQQSPWQGATWLNGQITLFDAYPSQDTWARASNDSGLTCGKGNLNASLHHAVIWQNGAFTDLGSLAGPNFNSEAYGVNDNGWICGGSDTTIVNQYGRVGHAFIYHDGTMQDIGGYTGATAFRINNFGQVIGWDFAPEFGQTGFYWSESTGGHALNGLPSDINNLGQIVGYSPWMQTGFLFLNGSYTYMGNSIYPLGINDSSDMVGRSESNHAVIWRNFVRYDLDSLLTQSGWSLDLALKINNAGQILAHATQSPTGAVDENILLNPVAEPSTIWAIAILTLVVILRSSGRTVVRVNNGG